MGIKLNTTFLNLDHHSGINPAAVAWYELLTEGKETPELNMVLLNGALISVEGDEAQEVYARFRSNDAGPAILPLSEEKQNALDRLKAFVGHFRQHSGVCSCSSECLLREAACEALSVLGA